MNFHFHIPPYVSNSAGIRAMYYLAQLTQSSVSEARSLDFISLALAKDTVCVYPDCVGPRNPRHAKRIIRFMCAPIDWPKPGFYGGGTIPKEELVFCYDEWYLKDLQSHCESEVHLLPIPCIEPNLFWPEPKTIRNVIYFGKEKPIYFDKGTIIITRTSPETRFEAAALLRKTENFFTLDHYTMMAHEAELCGCNVFKMFRDSTYEPYSTRGQLYLQRPSQDVAIAKRFNEIAERFFNERK